MIFRRVRGLRSIWPAVITTISILLVIVNPALLNGDYGFFIALLLLLSAALWDNLSPNLYTACGFFLFAITGARLQHTLMQAIPVTLDPVFRRADLALGFDTVWLWHAIAAHRAWRPVLDVAYAYLPVAMALTWIAEQDRAYRRAVLIAGFTCFAFYVLFPAAGPGFYDWNTGVAYGWRNCMPSMHLAWAILAARYARRQPLRCVLWGYVALLVLATIGLGQHYVIDLLAAVPYSLAVSWCAELDFSALLGRTPKRDHSLTLHFIPQPAYGKERRQG